MKNLTKPVGDLYPHVKKLTLIMRLSVLLILIAVFTSTASVYSQATKLTIKMENARLSEVFDAIEKQSEFYFFYNRDYFNDDRIVSVDVKNKLVDEVLKELLQGEAITWEIFDRNILLRIPEAPLTTDQQEMMQQQRTVSGTVTDEGDQPLPGVTVILKGTTRGTVTNADGEYLLNDIPEEATLQFSFVGMLTQEIEVEGRITILVVMEEETIGIEEVIAVGYGTQKRRDIIGSVSTVSADDIISRPGATFDVALQGMASGVSVQSANGVPGAPTKITIRGMNSINSSTDPLWIIDGMPVYSNPSGLTQNEGNITTGQSPMSLINPNDIESIQVLKDAAATSIYGSRASNGVIIITTKTGKSGKGDLNVDFSSGISEVSRTPQDVGYVNTPEWFNVMDRAYNYSFNRDFAMSDFHQYAPMAFDRITRQQAESTNTNWFNETFKTGNFIDLNLSSANATEKGDYFMSFNYREDEGVQIHNNLKRLTGRTNLNLHPVNNLTLGARLNLSYTNNNRLPNQSSRGANATLAEGGINFLTTSALPWIPVYHQGRPNQYFNPYSGFNGVATSDPKNFLNELEQFRGLGGFSMEYQVPFIDGLKLRTEGSFDVIQSINTAWVGREVRLNNNQEPSAYASEESVTYYSLNYNGYGTYSKQIGIHALDLVGGIEAQRILTKRKSMTGENLTGNYQELGSPGQMLNMYAGISGERYLLAYFGRANYKLNDRYLLGLSIRRDGTSAFTNDYRWGTFAAYSAGWIITEEDFMSFLGDNAFLKLRGSYGETGNQNVRSGLHVINYNGNLNYGGIDIGGVNGTLPGNLPVMDLTWETTKSSDIGLDFAFLKNRINGSFALYKKYVEGMLLESPLPASTGITPPGLSWPGMVYTTNANRVWSNIGDMVNEGIEFDIHTVNVDKKFRWSTDFNIAFNSNEIKKLSSTADRSGQGIIRGSTISRVGYRRLVWYMADYAGVNPQTGIPMIYELDKEVFADTGETERVKLPSGEDNTIPATNANILGNRFILEGKSQDPTYYGGLTNKFEYKGFDFSFLLSFSGGNYIYDYDEQLAIVPSETRIFKGDIMEGSWKQPGDEAKYPQLRARGTFIIDGKANANFNHEWVEYNLTMYKGDFLRLNHVILGYNLPKSVIDKWTINGLRIYVSGTNLLTFTDYPGFDPEGATYVYTAQIPQLKMYTLGLKLKF